MLRERLCGKWLEVSKVSAGWEMGILSRASHRYKGALFDCSSEEELVHTFDTKGYHDQVKGVCW